MRNTFGILAFSLVLLSILLGLISVTRSGWGASATAPSIVLTMTAEAIATPPELDVPPATPVVTAPTATPAPQYTITGRVIGLDGEPVSGAQVAAGETLTSSDSDGRFQVETTRRTQWVTVDHPNFISRTRAASEGSPVLVRLTPDDGATIALHFVGDTMFGRRFYDPDEDGSPTDGLLPIGAGVTEHLELLSHVQPLLETADITAINLESSLSDDPYIDPTGPRPANYHPTKDYVFATHKSAAAALRAAGVDVIDIANNHLYDALDTGVEDTLAGLEQAGFQAGAGYFGAGLSETEAWEPATMTVRGQTIAFLGCTSITYPFVEGTPQRDQISYFASDDLDKGGAARCEEDKIRSVVGKAVDNYDVVIFMVHGGSEYERAPTGVLKTMTHAARAAGANLVINHQTHVVSGFDWDGSTLIAWSLGNFVFDQTVWPTLETYLLAVHLRHGDVIRAYAEPLMIEGYVPKGLTGGLAEYVARGAAGRESGPFLVEDGAMEVDTGGRANHRSVTVSAAGSTDAGTIFPIDDGWWVSNFAGVGEIQLGRDLLWVGSFEDEDVDDQYLEGSLWRSGGPNKSLGSSYAYEGEAGVRLQRGARDDTAMVMTPLYRIPIEAGRELSVVGMVRGTANADARVQLSWYRETRGPSSMRTVTPIQIQSPDEWQAFRVDVAAPANAIAVGLFLRLERPPVGLATVDFDDIRLVEWSSVGTRFSPLYDHLRILGRGDVTLSKELLPGTEIGSPPDFSTVTTWN